MMYPKAKGDKERVAVVGWSPASAQFRLNQPAQVESTQKYISIRSGLRRNSFLGPALGSGREFPVGINCRLGERIVAADEPDLERIDVRCLHLADEPKDLGNAEITIGDIHPRRRDVESPCALLGGIEAKCHVHRHVFLKPTDQFRPGIDLLDHRWICIGRTPFTL